ncbi:MAG: exo-alpha-sialidase [Opitutaceae bacterium]|nr:exo-alpha-sialidase [Opitutaceae bacterium]
MNPTPALFALALLFAQTGAAVAAETPGASGQGAAASLPLARPDPVRNPGSPRMLAGAWVPADPSEIDFARLPRIPVEHVVVSDVSARKGVNQHNYLAHFSGRFWAMWSDGPRIEDYAGQVVKYSTSLDGRVWTEPKMLTGYPPQSGPDSPHYNSRDKEGFRYFARGFWIRGGEMLALVAMDDTGGFFGAKLELRAYRWNERTEVWDEAGVVQSNAINNFPPQLLPSGAWAMTRRKHDYQTSGVELLIGGVDGIDRWISQPVVGGSESGSALKAEEPIWYTLPGGHLAALFRDNGDSRRIHRAFSIDGGRTWSTPVATDFPDARSKFHAIRLRDGRYVLVSNSNPKKRDPLTLALSDDGLVYTKLFYVVGGRHVDYPHLLEHDGFLYIAHSGAKRSVEIERIRIGDLEAVPMPGGGK